jgi:hypothetical protein
LPKEELLACTSVRNGSAAATTEHVKETIKEYMQPDQIAFVVTDSASYYVGKHAGMIERMRSDPSFNKVNGLPDFCHKTENLLQEVIPKWVTRVLEDCRTVATLINDHNIVKYEIHEYIIVVDGSVFKVVPALSATRYAEYLPLQTIAILTDIKVLSEALPSLVEHPSLGNKVVGVLKIISSCDFISRVILITKIYQKISYYEKQAQSISFGPFEYSNLVSDMKASLTDMNYLPEDVKLLLNDNIFKFTTEYDHKKKEISLNLEEITSKLPSKTRLEMSEVNLEDIKDDLDNWITAITDKIDVYHVIPKVVSLATSAFSLHEGCTDDMVMFASELAKEVNYIHEQCSTDCKNVDCKCFKDSHAGFIELFRQEYDPVEKNKLMKKKEPGNPIKYIEAFSTFFHEKYISKISTNVYRLLEIIQLMKPSQASTERVMSHISNTVHNRFESKYSFDKEFDENHLDMVNIETFLRFNTNMVQIDTDLAREMFLKNNHTDALMKTKPATTQSSTILTLIDNMKMGKKNTSNISKRSNDFPTTNQAKKKKLTEFQGFSKVKDNKNEQANKISKDICSNGIKVTHHKSEDTRGSDQLEMDADASNTSSARKIQLKKTKEKYCHCNRIYFKKDKFVGCDNEQKCISFINRYKEENMKGGDWFHMKCVQLNKLQRKNKKWYCPVFAANQ